MMTDLTGLLPAALARHIDGFEDLIGFDRLSGGANQETYRIRIRCRGAERTICLRRAAGGTSAEGQPGLATEAALFRAAASAGVPEPDVLGIFDQADRMGEGFFMTWLDGETLGARIARGEAQAGVRSLLAGQCGELLARIHGIDLDATGLRAALEPRSTEAVIRLAWERYQSYGTAQPMIDYTARWLLDHLPAEREPCLVHGDFRNGNLMVTPEAGITAVLDWEGAHIGDPMRDLGWLCTNSWRFGVSECPVGGFGAYEDLFAGYERISGKTVDPECVRFWVTFGSFSWAIGCLTMAEHYRHGPDATVERPAIGRRSSECQVDCVNLLIPGPIELPHVPETAPNTDMPRRDELLRSVRDFLHDDVMRDTDGRTRFLARVAGNTLDIVLRDGHLGPTYRAVEREKLAAVLGDRGNLDTMRQQLSDALRDGSLPRDTPGLDEYLRFATVTRVLIDQPRYSGCRTATAGAGPDAPD